MLNLTHKNGYWIVKNDAGDTLLATEVRSVADDYIFWNEVEQSRGYQDWLTEQDALFAEECV